MNPNYLNNDMDLSQDKLITKKQAADIFGVCVRTVERMKEQGLIQIHQISKRRVGLWLSEVLAYAGKNPPPSAL